MTPTPGRTWALLRGPAPRPSTYRTTTRLVTGGIALAYLTAFLSLLVQVRGLLGRDGILPVGEYLDTVRALPGGAAVAWWRVPTLAWLSHGDGALVGICAAGALASVLLLMELAPLATAATCWVLYLSLESVGEAFLSFQWDTLLLEAGFLLLFLVPLGWKPTRQRRGPWRPAVWLFWWLLFRLILESGVVKLASGDPTWRDLTALAYHYQTQPLPNPVAWYAHLLPLWFQRGSTALTFGAELLAPLLLLLRRRARMAGAAAVVALQLLIAATGNYGFFNLLTIAIALSLFDDAFWKGALGRIPGVRRLLIPTRPADTAGGPQGPGERGDQGRPAGSGGRSGAGRAGRLTGTLRRVATAAFGVVAVGLGGVQVVRSTGLWHAPAPVQEAWSDLSPFHVVNAYGLFATMTTTRPELTIEGRTTRGDWRPLDFRWKADRTSERPRQVAPYMPRLDWQMWFAALRAEGTSSGAPVAVRYDSWLLRFVERLLAGSPAVWGLLGSNPAFRGDDGRIHPPDEIRVLLYEYRFTRPSERRSTGDWWSRREVGVYLPPVRRTPGGILKRAPAAP